MKKSFAVASFFGLLLSLGVGASAATTSSTFNTNLSFQMTGANVTALQQFLTTQGDYSGPITGNYLSLTTQAVKQFQVSNKVTPASGYFGPLTRAKANTIVLAGTSSSSPSIVTASALTSTSTPSTSTGVVAGASTNLMAYLQLQISSMYQTVQGLQQRFFGRGSKKTAPPPAPTSTIQVVVTVSGGTASAGSFNLTIQDTTKSSMIFSGAASAGTPQFTITQGDSYAVAETATANSQNYSISLGSECSGTVSANPITCPITDTYTNPVATPPPVVPSPPAPPAPTTSTPTTPPSSTTQGGIVWGAYSGNDPSGLASLTSLVGKSPNIQAIFLSLGLDSFPSNYTQTVGAAGKTLLIFWEPDDGTDGINQPNFNYSAILSGKYDSNMQQFAAAAKAYGYPVILVPMDEMNGNWDPWCGTVNGNTPAQFTQAWIHIHNIFSGVSNVKFGWDPNNTSVPDTSANAISAYWPGAQYVDYVGVDGFNGNGDPWQSFTQDFPSSLMSQMASYGKPVYLFSIGSTVNPSDPTAKALWIKEGLGPNGAISGFPNFAGWIWFNANGGSNANWLVNSDPASLAAFQAALP